VIYAGVDPGLKGAIAVLDQDGAVLNVRSIPLVSGGTRARDTFDLPTIRDVFMEWRERGSLFVTVERLQPLPAKLGGGIANFARGVSCGFVWMLTALDVPYQLVAPRAWQKALFLGTPGEDTKQRSVLAAQRLFPSVDLRRDGRGRPDHNLADSLLLAEFGRRIHTSPRSAAITS
jgi:hypothetical protein